jgi:hypothetical protein
MSEKRDTPKPIEKLRDLDTRNSPVGGKSKKSSGGTTTQAPK